MVLKLKTLCLFCILCTGLISVTCANTDIAVNNNEDATLDSPREHLSGRRVMETFDFEERSVNYSDLPMYWYKVIRTDEEGFPHYSTGKLDHQYKRSGQYSFKLMPDGGSIGFQYDHRRIRVKPGSDFQVTGYVHLEQARSAKVRLSCSLTNRLGKIIEESVHTSSLIGMDDLDSDGWARMEVYVPGNFPDARYLTIGIWLLQEEQWRGDTQLESHIFRRDVKAVAWFDDITVFQLPRVILKTDKPGNVFDGDETPTLKLEIDGVGTLDYNVQLTVHNSEGKSFIDKSWFLAGIQGNTKDQSYELSDIPAGLYHARLKIMSAERVITTRLLTFCKLAPLSGEITSSGMNFGILCLDDGVGDWNTAIRLTQLCNAKLLKLPVWKKQPDQSEAIFNTSNFDKKLLELQKHNVEVVATFSELPNSMAMKMDIGRRTLLDVLSQDVDLWLPQVAVMLAQYARQVPYWQIGNEQIHGRQIWDPRIRPVMNTMRHEFQKFIDDPLLTVPLNVLFDIQESQIENNRISLGIPSDIVPAQIPGYIQDFRNRDFQQIWAIVDPLDFNQYRREDVLIDFAKRIAYARVGQTHTTFINHPWIQRTYNARPIIEPTELMLVFRTLADQLGGTRYLGQFDIAPGIPALIYDRDGQGCLITWNDYYHKKLLDQQTEVELYLGENPVQIDLFGNRQTLPTQRGIAKLKINDWPIILTGIDTRIAMLKSSLKLDPDVIEATISRQKTKLVFVNPFNIPISGRLRIMANAQQQNWNINPVSFNFVLQANQKLEQELNLKFPRNELGGDKKIQAYFTIDADRTYRFQSEIPFSIQLPEIDINIFTLRINQTDMLIQQMVTNNSAEEVSLNSFLDLPDGDRIERAIYRLPPGGVSTKSYPIRQAIQWLGKYIRIGIYDPKGTKRINYEVEIN